MRPILWMWTTKIIDDHEISELIKYSIRNVEFSSLTNQIEQKHMYSLFSSTLKEETNHVDEK